MSGGGDLTVDVGGAAATTNEMPSRSASGTERTAQDRPARRQFPRTTSGAPRPTLASASRSARSLLAATGPPPTTRTRRPASLRKPERLPPDLRVNAARKPPIRALKTQKPGRLEGLPGCGLFLCAGRLFSSASLWQQDLGRGGLPGFRATTDTGAYRDKRHIGRLWAGQDDVKPWSAHMTRTDAWRA